MSSGCSKAWAALGRALRRSYKPLVPLCPLFKKRVHKQTPYGTPAHSASSAAIGIPVSQVLKLASRGRSSACRGCSSELHGRPKPNQRPRRSMPWTNQPSSQRPSSKFGSMRIRRSCVNMRRVASVMPLPDIHGRASLSTSAHVNVKG